MQLPDFCEAIFWAIGIARFGADIAVIIVVAAWLIHGGPTRKDLCRRCEIKVFGGEDSKTWGQ